MTIETSGSTETPKKPSWADYLALDNDNRRLVLAYMTINLGMSGPAIAKAFGHGNRNKIASQKNTLEVNGESARVNIPEASVAQKMLIELGCWRNFTAAAPETQMTDTTQQVAVVVAEGDVKPSYYEEPPAEELEAQASYTTPNRGLNIFLGADFLGADLPDVELSADQFELKDVPQKIAAREASHEDGAPQVWLFTGKLPTGYTPARFEDTIERFETQYVGVAIDMRAA